MKQNYEHTYLYFLLIYIVNMTHNGKYIFLSFIVEMEISRVSNTTFLIQQLQFFDKFTLKNNLNK